MTKEYLFCKIFLLSNRRILYRLLISLGFFVVTPVMAVKQKIVMPRQKPTEISEHFKESHGDLFPKPKLEDLPSLKEKPIEKQTIKIEASREGKEIKIQFIWSEKVPPLALFENNHYWYVVFRQESSPILPPLTTIPVDGVQSFEELKAEGATVFKLKIDAFLKPIISQKEQSWIITYSPKEIRRRTPCNISLPSYLGDTFKIELEEDIDDEITVQEPQNQTEFKVFPFQTLEKGIPEKHVFDEFTLYPSVQGIIYQIKDESLETSLEENHLIFSRSSALSVSPTPYREVNRTLYEVPTFFSEGNEKSLKVRLEKLKADLIKLPQNQHIPFEMEISWVYLLLGLGAEAVSTLDHIAYERKSMFYHPLYRAFYGFAAALAQRFSTARFYLASLTEEPEVKIWQDFIDLSSLGGGNQEGKAALERLEGFSGLLAKYPPNVRDQFVLSILRAALVTENLDILKTFLDKKYAMHSVFRQEVRQFAEAKIDFLKGKKKEAKEAFTSLLEKAKNPQVIALCNFELLLEQFKEEKISRKDLLSKLESLRFKWRGDIFEYRVSRFLVDQLWEEKRYLSAIKILKSLIKYFPELARQDGLEQLIRDGLTLYYHTSSSNVLKNISIYENYFDYISQGKVEEEILFIICENLVSINLLNEAKNYLKSYLKRKVKNASVSSEYIPVLKRIAAISLLERKPQEALTMLYQLVHWPEEESVPFQLLQSEAYFQLKQLDKALAVLGESADCLQVKGELLMSDGRWLEAAILFEKSLNKRSLEQKNVRCVNTILNLAICYVLADEQGKIKEIISKYQDFMDNSQKKEMFHFIVGQQFSSKNVSELTTIKPENMMKDVLREIIYAPKKG